MNKEIAELHMEFAPNDKDEWSNADILAKAYLNLLAKQEGHVLVPLEPTEEMINLAFKEYLNTHPQAGIQAALRNAYKAMITKAQEE